MSEITPLRQIQQAIQCNDCKTLLTIVQMSEGEKLNSVSYCKKCHDDLAAIQARLQGHARSIFFTDEQLKTLEQILERESRDYINNKTFQQYLKSDYDLLDVTDKRRAEVDRYVNVAKMYRKIVKSMSELGLFGGNKPNE